MDFKSTSIRAASGCVYILIIVLACWAGELGVSLLAILFATLGIAEFRKMRFGRQSDDTAMSAFNALGGALLSLSVYVYPIFFWILWLMLRMIIAIYDHHEHPEKRFAVDMAAQVYIGVPMALMTAFAYFAQDIAATCMPILSIFIIIWVNDTGAFIFGSTLGKHKLFPRVSPKKSWEGFWGGLICSAATGALIGWLDSPLSAEYIGNKLIFWTIAGVIISVASTFGDLFESVIKRNLQIKDSGNLIPGHGGILDRIDSLLMAIPAVAVYLAFYAMVVVEVLNAYGLTDIAI
ncbi:MAG: phosphatidate cytidylyltransferase [Muribaculaceae bacterium]|nr:phosphatidate cytidylyltransferase [Muribaculaceae bacterium]